MSSFLLPRSSLTPAATDDLPAAALEVVAAEGGSTGREFRQLLPDEGDRLLLGDKGVRYPFLDVTRVACIIAVAIDHGVSAFAYWNVLFTQAWVLQYLFIVCGVCYGMSDRPLCGYLKKLFLIVVAGTLVNWVAWVIMGMNWSHKVFVVVFQFWFVAGLILYCVILAPLKAYLRRMRAARSIVRTAPSLTTMASWSTAGVPRCALETPEHLQNELLWGEARCSSNCGSRVLLGVLVIGGGMLVIWQLTMRALYPLLKVFVAPGFLRLTKSLGADTWGFPETLEDSEQFLWTQCFYLQMSLRSMFVTVVFPMLHHRISWGGWLVLADMYLGRLAFYRGKDERFFHGLDLMLLGMVVYFFGLRHRRKIGNLVVQCWMLVPFLCVILWPVGHHGRFDQDPPHDPLMRIRFNVIELILVAVWFLTGERAVDWNFFDRDRCVALNTWALLLYLVHQAVHLVVPQPFNWAVFVAMLLPCWLWYRRRSPPSSSCPPPLDLDNALPAAARPGCSSSESAASTAAPAAACAGFWTTSTASTMSELSADLAPGAGPFGS